MIELPVCCTDTGNEYGNECMAECNGETNCDAGRCSDIIGACTTEYAPICCNGATFPNSCSAQRAGVNDTTVCDDGRC